MSTIRSTAAALTSVAALAVLAWLPTVGPSLLTGRPDVFGWWELHGTAAASIGLLHLIALVAAAYVTIVLSLVAVASIVRLPRAALVIARLAPRTLRRFLVVGVLAGAVATPSAALAQEPIVVVDVGGETVSDSPFVLTDLGEAPTTEPRSTDLPAGPADVQPISEPDTTQAVEPADELRPPTVSAAPDAWLVEDGDNLWTIAETMLADHHGRRVDEPTVAAYWRRLIAANESSVADPDLIYPGQVLALPPMVTAGS